MVCYYHFYTQIFLESALASVGATGHIILMLVVTATTGEDPQAPSGGREGSRDGQQQPQPRLWAGQLSSLGHQQTAQAAALSPAHLTWLLAWREVSALAPAQLGQHSPVADLQFSMNMHTHGEEEESSSYRNGKKKKGCYVQVLNDICKWF